MEMKWILGLGRVCQELDIRVLPLLSSTCLHVIYGQYATQSRTGRIQVNLLTTGGGSETWSKLPGSILRFMLSGFQGYGSVCGGSIWGSIYGSFPK